MAPKAKSPPKKQCLPQFPRMGVGERKLEPAIRDIPFQFFSIGEGFLPAFHLLAIVLAVDTFHLHFAGAVFAGLNGWLAPCRVVGQLVAGYLPFIAAAATAPPESIARFGSPVRRANHCEAAVDLADSVAWFGWHGGWG